MKLAISEWTNDCFLFPNGLRYVFVFVTWKRNQFSFAITTLVWENGQGRTVTRGIRLIKAIMVW